MLLGTIATKSGTFLLTASTHSDGRYKIAVTGPTTADFIDRGAAGSPVTEIAYDSLYRAASEFCYSWSADHINVTRNDLESARNDLESARNEIITKLTNTVYDLRDDIRAVTHRAVNVDEGIYTQKACWETACEENKALRVASMKRSWVKPISTVPPNDGYIRAEDDYLANKTTSYHTHAHVDDIANDLPQVPPRTPGSIDSGGNII